MSKEFLGRGWKFPVNIDSKGKINLSEFDEDIKESIKIVLSTSKGERVMRPDFGCNIHEYVFATMDTTTIEMMKQSVREALTLWEPRIKVIIVDISQDSVEEGKLNIVIDYIVRSTNNEFNLVYPFYLMEGR